MKTPQQVKQAYILNEEKKASEVYDRLRNSIEDGLERRYGEGNIMLFEHFPEDVVTTVFNEFSVYGWTMEYVLEGTEYYIGEKLLFDKIYN